MESAAKTRRFAAAPAAFTSMPSNGVDRHPDTRMGRILFAAHAVP
jgi:hypothetical protein